MTAPLVAVDTTSGVPPWRQIREQIDRVAGSEKLPAGSRLPTIRQLAADLGIAASTVARAYRALEASGVTRTARRRGTVVAVRRDPTPEPLRVAAAEYVARARELGVEPDAALRMVRSQYA